MIFKMMIAGCRHNHHPPQETSCILKRAELQIDKIFSKWKWEIGGSDNCWYRTSLKVKVVCMETKKIFESKSSIFKRFIFESESDIIESEYLWNKCWQDRYIISTRKIPIIGKRGGSNICQLKIYQISIEWNLPFSPRSPLENLWKWGNNHWDKCLPNLQRQMSVLW